MDMEFWSYIQYFSLKSNALSRLQKCPNYHTANTSDYPAEKKNQQMFKTNEQLLKLGQALLQLASPVYQQSTTILVLWQKGFD